MKWVSPALGRIFITYMICPGFGLVICEKTCPGFGLSFGFHGVHPYQKNICSHPPPPRSYLFSETCSYTVVTCLAECLGISGHFGRLFENVIAKANVGFLLRGFGVFRPYILVVHGRSDGENRPSLLKGWYCDVFPCTTFLVSFLNFRYYKSFLLPFFRL